jgi:hypothetical protein
MLKNDSAISGAFTELSADQMNLCRSLPVLEYPRTLYAYRFQYFSHRGFILFGGFTLFTVAFAYVGLAVAGPRSLHALFIAGAACGLAAAVLGYRVLNHSHDLYRITTAGIEMHGKMTPWPKISRVGANGKPTSDRVQLFFSVRLAGGFSRNFLLFEGTGLDVKEYEQLIESLKRELTPAYPHLELGGYFKIET